ncbi:HPr family phosphocarrier protein [uncultured Eubacterium sp.]|uniref:HPr family phosphocarrier protein n=1 Tax=uncultured Eubacterium sp. TaxID=165185 RepID=UPI002672CE36|nr:HPr family phosphocarrier protein [uncultured Eubacterium sp.]
MTTKDITIEIKQGTETSPVAKCVQVASQFESKIYVEYETKKVNAKSIMGMMALGIVPGQTVKVSAEGGDEVQAIESIEKYLGNK